MQRLTAPLSVRRTFEPTLATRFQRGRTQPARDSARARSAATQRRLCRRAKQNQGSPPTDGATAVFCDSPLARTATCIMKRPAAALCDRARRLPHSGAGFTGPCKSFLTHPAPSAQRSRAKRGEKKEGGVFMEEQISLEEIACAGQAEETACRRDDPLNYKPFHYGSPCACVGRGG